MVGVLDEPNNNYNLFPSPTQCMKLLQLCLEGGGGAFVNPPLGIGGMFASKCKSVLRLKKKIYGSSRGEGRGLLSP